MAHVSVLLALAALLGGCATHGSGHGQVPDGQGPEGSVFGRRNVLLLIGDGMGATAVTMARNYEVGAAGRLAIDDLPVFGQCTTYAVYEDAPGRPDFVTDSASSATALATGHKTSNRRLSTAPTSGEILPTILERARAAGFRTGLVSTATLADATPAAFAAHIDYRWCWDPATIVACPSYNPVFGGRGSIVEQMVATHPDVLLGGGAASFAERIAAGPGAGRTVLDAAKAAGYRVVTKAGELAALEPGEAVLGLFARENFVPRWAGDAAGFPPGEPGRCDDSLVPVDQPDLAEMLTAALRVLSADAADGGSHRGFFLMAEGAMIDKQAHGADACGQIGETIAFDRAVAVARDFAARNPGTLVIVVGDHDHAAQIVDTAYAAVNPGATTTLRTVDGAAMTIAYATSARGMKQQHTGVQVPIYAFGPGSEALGGLVDHTDVHRVMAEWLGLEPGGEVVSP